MKLVQNAKCAAKISLFGLRSWTSNYRMIMTALVLIAMLWDYCAEINEFAKALNSPINVLAVLPNFYYNRFYHMNIQFGIVLMFSNAPFHREDSLSCVMRSGYRKWCAGQLLYILQSSAIYVLFIFLLTIIFSLPSFGFSEKWGKVFSTLAQEKTLLASKKILSMYNPQAALLHTITLLFLLSVIMGLLMFFLSNMIGKGAGVIGGATLVLLGQTPDFSQYVAAAVKISPCSLTELYWLTGKGAYPGVSYAYTFLGIMAVILLAANVFIFSNKTTRAYAYNMDI